MRAVVMTATGGPEVLTLGEVPDPIVGETDLLVEVEATGLNRADLLQRRGLYPPPPGASSVLGLEMAGTIVEKGPGVRDWEIGERVCALLPGGGYAQFVSIPSAMAMRVPTSLSMEEAAAIPEVFLTAYLNLFLLGGLKADQTVLIHAGASGVGTAAIQLVREAGSRSIVTAGSHEKIARCVELGAEAGWNYREGPFLDWVLEQTGGRGVELILDFIGEPYFDANLHSLAIDGRLVVIGTMGGSIANTVPLSTILSRRLQIIGTALRSQSVESKIALTCAFSEFAMARFADGRLRPIVDSIYDWRDVSAAHERMEQNANVGKIILKVGGEE